MKVVCVETLNCFGLWSSKWVKLVKSDGFLDPALSFVHENQSTSHILTRKCWIMIQGTNMQQQLNENWSTHHPVQHFAENHVFTVQPRRFSSQDEELWSVGVRTSVRHTHLVHTQKNVSLSLKLRLWITRLTQISLDQCLLDFWAGSVQTLTDLKASLGSRLSERVMSIKLQQDYTCV